VFEQLPLTHGQNEVAEPISIGWITHPAFLSKMLSFPGAVIARLA
jgi:hypothetical protein